MTKSESGMIKLIQELRNRRVFRVTAVYLGVGYAILEASSIIVPTMGFPGVIVKIILGLLVIGFPVAIILAWMFQMTPEGLRRSPKSGEKQSQSDKPLTGNATIIVLLIIIAGLLVYSQFRDSSFVGQDSLSLIDSKSIAVLPFTPFTKTDDDQSFADGMHDDILTQLSKVADLKVISRTSVMQYKETTMLISDIARELGVANVLEGSVRRVGDQIRIVAQLINAETDEHLWAETFDRKYADIFSMQSEVAQKIARALKAKLTPKEKQYIETKPTENQKAWELYVRAELLWDADIMERDSIAVIFEQAVELDPGFLLPYTELTALHAYAYFDGSGLDPRPERLEKARAALEKAIQLDPNASETHRAQGYFHYYGARNYAQALEEFSIAMESQPNNSDLLAATAFVQRRLGQWDESLEKLQKAVSLDPNDGNKVRQMRDMTYMMRLWDLSERYQGQLSAIHSGNEPGTEQGRYYIELAQSGDLEKLQSILDQLLTKFDPEDLLEVRKMHAAFTRDYESLLAIELADPEGSNLNIGNLLELTGQVEMAQTYFDSARIEAEKLIEESPNNWNIYGDLGVALAKLGRTEEALDWGKQEVELMSLSRDRLSGPTALEDLAEIYLVCGRYDESINLYAQILSMPGWLSANWLKLSPLYDPLRNQPRFQKLLKQYSGQSG
ncbi:MAG: tetratricopeptide repeat protein [Candidatus Marinimicrobia bacterium]|nr:tetratricopeptide repeat protein [Candidatus Neomarinimicrobiota bacterium]